ncbi:MAG: rRNA methyltransferase, partial [Clostridia bacterium]|nr:rRNA methyltransferase [Clostridia bacterium]
ASGLEPKTLLDCGAGTGAATWAADSLLELDSVTCLEREEAMRSVGSRLMRESGGALADAAWESCDLTAPQPLPKAQLVVEGYMLGELREDMRLRVAQRLWDAAEQMLLMIEPGTPQGFANLAAVKAHLAGLGVHVAAPCPAGAAACPMQGEDWCHFSVRVQRTKLHKALKGGDAPYEDEKYCYLALTREAPKAACAARVLRHPMIAPGRITLTLCEGGEKRIRAVTKKDPLWKRARKIEAGDEI